MRGFKSAVLIVTLGMVAAAQSPEPPLSETRLSVHTLVREDLFAGFLLNDMTRFARGERNVEALLEQRPPQRANLLAWRGSAALYRAVLAHEAGNADEFQRRFQQVRDSFAEASKLQSDRDGVQAIIGGSFSIFADRLPESVRAASWSQAYDAYAQLWKAQSPTLDRMPLHHRGELMTGLAQAAQRTGRSEEAAQVLDRILVSLAGTPYEAEAKRWKAEPTTAASSKLTCKTCHEGGRLPERLKALGG